VGRVGSQKIDPRPTLVHGRNYGYKHCGSVADFFVPQFLFAGLKSELFAISNCKKTVRVLLTGSIRVSVSLDSIDSRRCNCVLSTQ